MCVEGYKRALVTVGQPVVRFLQVSRLEARSKSAAAGERVKGDVTSSLTSSICTVAPRAPHNRVGRCRFCLLSSGLRLLVSTTGGCGGDATFLRLTVSPPVSPSFPTPDEGCHAGYGEIDRQEVRPRHLKPQDIPAIEHGEVGSWARLCLGPSPYHRQ